MELHWVRYFVAAADAGSVSRGAERVGVAQPSMSAQIRKLEHHLGTTLFDRIGSGVVLTESGRAFYPRARRILAEVRDAVDQLHHDVAGGKGALSIGAIPTIAPYVLPPALEALRVALPSCEVSIREDLTERLAEALVDNEIDCALISTPLDHPLLDVQVLGDERMLVCAPPNYTGFKKGAAVRFDDVRGQATVTLEDIHCFGRQMQGFCLSKQLAPRVVCRTTQLATIRELVNLGVGISIVPEMAAAADTAATCRYHVFAEEPPMRQLAVAWRRDRSRSRSALQFVDIVAEHLRRGRHAWRATGRRKGA